MRQQESLRTLTTCALVGRSMNHRCRKHLFFSIETSPRRKQTRLESKKDARIMSLRRIMDNNPALGQYVRHLRIDLGVNGVEVPNLTQHLPHILQLLSANSRCYLETVEIFAKAFSQVNFSSLPTLLQQSFFSFQSFISLSTLTLSNLTSVPASFITGFPNLRHLYLTAVFLIKDKLILPTQKAFRDASMDGGALPHGRSPPLSPTFSLCTLNVNRFFGLCAATFLELGPFSGLKKLTANISGISGARAFAQVIGSAANSLEMLDLYAEFEFFMSYPYISDQNIPRNVASNLLAFPFSFALPFDAGLYPSLRAITFRLQLASDCRWIADHDSVILKPPSETSNLGSVQLILTQYIDTLDDVVSRMDDRAGWCSLDEALNNRNFVRLSCVNVVVNLLTHSTSDSLRTIARTRTEQGISNVLPRLSASSSIKITKRVCLQVL